MTVFDSGFRLAAQLKNKAFRDQLQAAGWRSGIDKLIAVPSDFCMGDLDDILSSLEDKESIFLVRTHGTRANGAVVVGHIYGLTKHSQDAFTALANAHGR